MTTPEDPKDEGEGEGELDPKLYEAWPDAEPPAGFADRVLARRRAEAIDSPARRPRRAVRHAIMAGILAVAVGTALFLLRGGPQAVTGGRVAEARESIEIDGRGVAVAEAGADLAWRVERGDARVVQSHGDVFYRIEHGGAFVVETPAGQVTALGTCFRVQIKESDNMRIPTQGLAGAGVGAVLAATIVVTVYEGRVRVHNEHGDVQVAAGESATANSGRAPTAGAAAAGGEAIARVDDGSPKMPGLEQDPPGDAPRELLLQRDRAHRDQIAALQVRLGRLEADAKDHKGGPDGFDGPESRKFWDLTPEELKDMAAHCEIRYALPSYGNEPHLLGPKDASHFGIAENQLAAVNQAITNGNKRFMDEVRALYIEATGDTAGAETLDVFAMQTEIERKTGDEETLAIRKKLANERAGLVPPSDPRAGGPYERLMRLLLGAAADLEADIAKVIGDAKARDARDLFGRRAIMSGCDDDEK